MSDLGKDIEELHQETARTRYQFLKAELQTCFTALEMANYELSQRNLPVVGKEAAFVEDGVRTIYRFLPRLPAEQRMEIEIRLEELLANLDALKVKLLAPSR